MVRLYFPVFSLVFFSKSHRPTSISYACRDDVFLLLVRQTPFRGIYLRFSSSQGPLRVGLVILTVFSCRSHCLQIAMAQCPDINFTVHYEPFMLNSTIPESGISLETFMSLCHGRKIDAKAGKHAILVLVFVFAPLLTCSSVSNFISVGQMERRR